MCVLAIAGGMYGLGIHPWRAHAAQAGVAKGAMSERERELSGIIDDVAAAKAAIVSARATLAAAAPLHAVSSQNERLAQLTRTAEASGLLLVEMQPGGASWDRRFGAVPIRMTGSGGYEAFTRFLVHLASDFPDVRVAGFSLAGQPGETRSPSTYTTELIWFTLPEGSPSRTDGAGRDARSGGGGTDK